MRLATIDDKALKLTYFVVKKKYFWGNVNYLRVNGQFWGKVTACMGPYHFKLDSVQHVKSTKQILAGATPPPPFFGNAKILTALLLQYIAKSSCFCTLRLGA